MEANNSTGSSMSQTTSTITVASPAAGFFLAEIIDNPHAEQSSIALPEGTHLDKVTYAKVVVSGPGHLSSYGDWTPSEIYAGDTVIVGNLSGIDVTVDGRKLLLLNEKHARAVFRG